VDYGDPPTADLFTGRSGDILDEGWLKSMNELEWRRRIGDCVHRCDLAGGFNRRGYDSFRPKERYTHSEWTETGVVDL